MKTMMKNLAALMICLSSFSAFAGTSPDVSVVYSGKKSFAIYTEQARHEVQSVKLKDKDGVVLLTDRIQADEAVARKYNLVNLPEGKYTLSIESNAKTIVQPLAITADAVEIDHEGQRTIFNPSLVMSDQRIDFTLLCLDPTAVTIQIIDEAGRKNYTSTTQEQGSVQRRFDITALSPGTYTVVTKMKDASYETRYTEVFTVGEAVASR